MQFASRPPSIRALLGWTPYSLLGSSWDRLRYAITYPKISFPVGVFLRHGGVGISFTLLPS
jgi:hypothetical protein